MPATQNPYVFALAPKDGSVVMWGGGGACITLYEGEVWFRDDPFVQDRQDLFSDDPPRIHSTAGRQHDEAKPLSDKPRRRRG